MATHNTDIIGGFSFRDEGDGCILGKYINTQTLNPFPEACHRLPTTPSSAPFVGDYRSVWLEQGQHHHATLNIKQNSPGRYDLEWNGPVANYRGVGMLVNGMLVGGYWQV